MTAAFGAYLTKEQINEAVAQSSRWACLRRLLPGAVRNAIWPPAMIAAKSQEAFHALLAEHQRKLAASHQPE